MSLKIKLYIVYYINNNYLVNYQNNNLEIITIKNNNFNSFLNELKQDINYEKILKNTFLNNVK